MSAPRFEIVRTDAEQPWHARMIASNGKKVFTSETYHRRNGALNAIAVAVSEFADHWIGAWDYRDGRKRNDAVVYQPHGERRLRLAMEIRDVDERALDMHAGPLTRGQS